MAYGKFTLEKESEWKKATYMYQLKFRNTSTKFLHFRYFSNNEWDEMWNTAKSLCMTFGDVEVKRLERRPKYINEE